MTTAWITDSSAITFLDTHKTNVTVPSESIFKKNKYEGLTDNQVFIGFARIDWEEGGHDAELEWVLIFDQPITEITFTDKTECTLQGMIEGKNLAKLCGEKEIKWGPASIGNNVIATMDETNQEIAGGKKITFKDLQGDDVLATMRLSFKKENGEEIQTREVPSTVLKKFPVVELLEELKKNAGKYGLEDCCVVNLGANGKESAYVNNRLLQIEAVLKENLSPEGILTNLTKGSGELKDRVRDELIKKLIDDQKGMGRGSKAHLEVSTPSKEIIGKAILQTA
ncbi:hypothetical protein [Desulfogranum marinum]|uniref:hypothetical protein n=1 Tax=Desulfogranum marinum TaxID=453220 RepID=UPI0029C7BE9F|nr:hypothetical protein [Desulfogranum marinum]